MPAVKAKQDWHKTLQAKLNAEAAAALEAMTAPPDDSEILLEPYFDKDGLHFGAYGQKPIHGLHFDAPHDTAAS